MLDVHYSLSYSESAQADDVLCTSFFPVRGGCAVGNVRRYTNISLFADSEFACNNPVNSEIAMAGYDKPSRDARTREQIAYMDRKIAAFVNGYPWADKHTHNGRLKWTNVNDYLHKRNTRAEQIGLQARNLMSYERTETNPGCLLGDHTKAMGLY